MSERQYDMAVFIGRMQPLHHGHIRNIKHALTIADHVLVVAGSANQPRTPKNPFTVAERTNMIEGLFPTDRVSVVGVEDYYPDALWLKNVQTVAHTHLINLGFEIFDANVAYRVPGYQGFIVSATVNNVFNNEHREFVGAPQIGRIALLKLQYAFGGS